MYFAFTLAAKSPRPMIGAQLGLSTIGSQKYSTRCSVLIQTSDSLRNEERRSPLVAVSDLLLQCLGGFYGFLEDMDIDKLSLL